MTKNIFLHFFRAKILHHNPKISSQVCARICAEICATGVAMGLKNGNFITSIIRSVKVTVVARALSKCLQSLSKCLQKWRFWGVFEPFLDLSRGVQTIEIESCQEMDFFVWDGSIEAIYTTAHFNFTAPPSVTACLWRDRLPFDGAVWWYIIGLFWLLTNCQV